jgi:hypothetical protein
LILLPNFRRQIVQRIVWSALVVAVTPFFDDRSCLTQAREPFQVQALVSQFAVEAFDMSILNWLTRFDEEQLYTILVSPSIMPFSQ